MTEMISSKYIVTDDIAEWETERLNIRMLGLLLWSYQHADLFAVISSPALPSILFMVSSHKSDVGPPILFLHPLMSWCVPGRALCHAVGPSAGEKGLLSVSRLALTDPSIELSLIYCLSRLYCLGGQAVRPNNNMQHLSEGSISGLHRGLLFRGQDGFAPLASLSRSA